MLRASQPLQRFSERNEQGRQVLEYVPGSLWHNNGPHTLTELRRVGGIIRALHRDAASFQVPEGAQWNTRYQLDQQEIICHNDLAPWNLVCGPERWVFIDWDASAPATRLWDLAWSSISFPPFEPGCDLRASAAAMHALLTGITLSRPDTVSSSDLWSQEPERSAASSLRELRRASNLG